MELLVSQQSDSWEQAVDDVKAVACTKIFDPSVVKFIKEISRSILSSRSFRNYPELMALAHWFREGHLAELRKEYENRRGDRIWVPSGIVLHIAPSNIDTLFVYSWFLSLLLGNCNIVRLSTHRGTQVAALLEIINSLLRKNEFVEIAKRNIIMSYDHDDTISRFLSKACQVRVIWGGDETVQRIRALPLSPLAREIVFGDRFSLALLTAESVNQLSDEEVNKLTQNFYNDTYWFNQMACSSPRLVVWIGNSSSISNARERFWSSLRKYIQKKEYRTEEAVGFTRLTTSYMQAASGYVRDLPQNWDDPHHMLLKEFNPSIKEQHCGGGLFFELILEELNQLKQLLSLKDQTITFFGCPQGELAQFATQLSGTGVSRIVPIGQALEFSPIWDGYDLFVYLTHEISLLGQH